MTNNYDRNGKKSKPSERFWNSKANTYDHFKIAWTDHIKRLNFLKFNMDDSEREEFDNAVKTIVKSIEKCKNLLIEVNDIVKINEQAFTDDYEVEIISDAFFTHVSNEVKRSVDGTLTVAHVNGDECHCYATGIMSEESLMPIIDGEYLILVKKSCCNL